MNIINRYFENRSALVPSVVTSFAVLAMWATAGAYPGQAQQSTQQTFSSATEATQSLFQAVQNNNVQAITNILGGPTELASSGDDAQDKADRELFVQKCQEMHRLGHEADGTVTLYVGAENWPFPVPLVEKNGAWHFDPETGMQEVLFRRIGENEAAAILICHEFFNAEKEYRADPNAANPADRLPTSLIAQASGASANRDAVLLNGYYFRVLGTRPANGASAATPGKATGGFALIAYPAKYRSSGVMTFIVTGRDVVYEKDLGPNTSGVASAITTFRKDSTWNPAD
jgi:hypothetical protein